MVDSSGESSYAYDIQDRLTGYTAPLPSGRTITYTYNNLNEKTSLTYKVDGVPTLSLTYNYYRNGWLKEVVSGNQTVASYTYDQVGNRERVNLGNGTYTTYGYDSDPRYRTSAIAHYRDGTPPVLLGEILYPNRDGAGNPLSMQDSMGTTYYTYDMNSRLDSATYPGVGLVDYNYDWVGNRVNPPAPPNPMEYNAADQLIRWPNVHQYDYDGAGNLISEWSDPRGASPQKTYAYTPANLLSEVVHTDAGTSSMTWDADGNRVSFTSSTGGTWQFVYDTTAGIPAVIEEYDGSGSVYYIREPDGELIARIGSSSVAYYHFDALGSTRLLSDAMGTVTDTYAYDAWGNLMAHTGTTTQPYQFVGELGYYTHWQDANLALLQLGVRFYDPQVGRFGQRDPIQDTLNRYAYVNDRPIVATDPSGLLFTRDFPRNFHRLPGESEEQCKARAKLLYDICVRARERIRDDEKAVCVALCLAASAFVKKDGRFLGACIAGCVAMVDLAYQHNVKRFCEDPYINAVVNICTDRYITCPDKR